MSVNADYDSYFPFGDRQRKNVFSVSFTDQAGCGTNTQNRRFLRYDESNYGAGFLPASFCEVGSRGPPFSVNQLINLSNPPSLLISEHAVASAAPAASYKSPLHPSTDGQRELNPFSTSSTMRRSPTIGLTWLTKSLRESWVLMCGRPCGQCLRGRSRRYRHLECGGSPRPAFRAPSA